MKKYLIKHNWKNNKKLSVNKMRFVKIMKPKFKILKRQLEICRMALTIIPKKFLKKTKK